MLNKTKFIVAGVATITVGTTVVVICKRKAFRTNRANVYKSLVDDESVMRDINEIGDCSKKIELQKKYIMMLADVLSAKNLKQLTLSVDIIKNFYDDVIECLNNQTPVDFVFEEDMDEKSNVNDGNKTESGRTQSEPSIDEPETSEESQSKRVNWKEESEKVIEKYISDKDFNDTQASNTKILNDRVVQDEGTANHVSHKEKAVENYIETDTIPKTTMVESFKEVEEEEAATIAEIPSGVTISDDGDTDNELERTDADCDEKDSEEGTTVLGDGSSNEPDGVTEDTTTEESGGLEDSLSEGVGVRGGDAPKSPSDKNSDNTDKIGDIDDILSRIANELYYLYDELDKSEHDAFLTFINDMNDVYLIDRDGYDEYIEKLIDVVSIESDKDKFNTMVKIIKKFRREFNNKLKKAREVSF